MSALMDLIAGDRREILLALAIDDWASLADSERFGGHLALGAGLDPTWLDLFSEAARAVTGADGPSDFIDARLELAEAQMTERTVERVDPTWVDAVASVPDELLDGLAGRWIDLVSSELDEVADHEKPWIRELAGNVVRFCRRARSEPDVLFAWSL